MKASSHSEKATGRKSTHRLLLSLAILSLMTRVSAFLPVNIFNPESLLLHGAKLMKFRDEADQACAEEIFQIINN
jgi:hypothetical protein